MRIVEAVFLKKADAIANRANMFLVPVVIGLTALLTLWCWLVGRIDHWRP